MFDNLFKTGYKFLKPMYSLFDNYKIGFGHLLIFLFILLIIYQIFDYLDVLPWDKDEYESESEYESETDTISYSDTDSEPDYDEHGKLIEGMKKKKGKKKKGGGVKTKKQKKKAKKKKAKKKAAAAAAAAMCEPAAVPVLPDPAPPEPPDENGQYLGQAYSYAKSIKAPKEIGMSSRGTIKALGKDIDGIIQYINVLTTGDSKASIPKGALGDAYFLKTPGKCTANDTGEKVSRSIYFDNVPHMPGLNGLVPSMIMGLDKFNPLSIMGAFSQSANPPCDKVTLKVINAKNEVGQRTRYVATSEISDIHPCNFVTTGINPITSAKCPVVEEKKKKRKRKKGQPKKKKDKKGKKKKGKKKKGKKKKGKKSGFETMSDFLYMGDDYDDDDESVSGSESSDSDSSEYDSDEESVGMGTSLISQHCANIKEDMFTHVYFSSLGLVGVYVLYRLMMKK